MNLTEISNSTLSPLKLEPYKNFNKSHFETSSSETDENVKEMVLKSDESNDDSDDSVEIDVSILPSLLDSCEDIIANIPVAGILAADDFSEEIQIGDNILDSKSAIKLSAKDEAYPKEMKKYSKPGKKVKGYRNLAKRQIAIGLGVCKKNTKHKEVVSTSEHINRKLHHQIYSTEDYPFMNGRSYIYWESITKTEHFKKFKIKAKEAHLHAGCYTGNTHEFNRNIVKSVMPNNFTVDKFKTFCDMFGWEYAKNDKQPLDKLPLRWSGSNANFYEPLVIRYHKDDSGRRTSVQGLCPYCPVHHDGIDDGYNQYFFNMSGCSYEAHVSRNHGVYPTGEEMAMPYFVKKEGQFAYLCMDCHRVNMLGSCRGFTMDSIAEVYRHCSHKHGQMNINKSRGIQYCKRH